METGSVWSAKAWLAKMTQEATALSNDENLRSKELAIRAYALTHETLLRRVLRSSAHAEERIVAAHFMGYARQSRAQIADLVWASHDVDDGVRNDAIRALLVLARSSARIARQIPAAGFVAMVSSGSWSDRNKAVGLLNELTRPRDPKLLGVLRSQALDALIEMARWRASTHADSSRLILGRIGGIEERRLIEMICGKRREIIQASNNVTPLCAILNEGPENRNQPDHNAKTAKVKSILLLGNQKTGIVPACRPTQRRAQAESEKSKTPHTSLLRQRSSVQAQSKRGLHCYRKHDESRRLVRHWLGKRNCYHEESREHRRWPIVSCAAHDQIRHVLIRLSLFHSNAETHHTSYQNNQSPIDDLVHF